MKYIITEEVKKQLVEYLANSNLPAKDAIYFITKLNGLTPLEGEKKE